MTEPRHGPDRRGDDAGTPGGAPGGTPDDFLGEAGRPSPGLVRELWAFLRENRKWWLLPILLVLLGLGALLVLTSTVAAPFIYTLF